MTMGTFQAFSIFIALLSPVVVDSFGIMGTTVGGNVKDLNSFEIGLKDVSKLALSFGLSAALSFNQPAFAATSTELGASSSANAKITTGGASTLQSGRTIGE